MLPVKLPRSPSDESIGLGCRRLSMALEVTEDGEDMEPPKKIGQSLEIRGRDRNPEFTAQHYNLS
jgi:hypothetical protein